MRLKLLKLQKIHLQINKIKSKILGKDRYKIFKKVLNHSSLFYILKITKIKLISRYYNNFLLRHFKMKKLNSSLSKNITK